ncbi:MAG TPA: lasso peptide biosynthesis protein [Pyrinomonadaceae bacterium]|nr:lasso peptide biosynthesis protein [Pyrinomonadaceae bacterium]
MIDRLRKTGAFIYRSGRKVLLQPDEALLLCRMAWWVVVLSIVARRYPLPRALEIVAGRQDQQPVAVDAARQEKLARLIDLLLSADVWVFKPICWKRAAVLHRYLKQTRIIFGVRNDPAAPAGKVTGHAWLEAAGKPILETTPPDYVTTYRFPSNEQLDPQLATITFE